MGEQSGMEKGNVVVIGNSGVGKSYLINAVLGEDVTVTDFGREGTTKQLSIHEHAEVPFRLIDTVGFEPTVVKTWKAIQAVKKWSKSSARAGQEDTRIHAIWFCVDGTSRKLFDKTIRDLSRATAMWPSLPVIAVITKSYSIPDRAENIEMVRQAFAARKRHPLNLKGVIPVVAATYVLNDTAFAAPEGITELIEATVDLLPEGIEAAGRDIAAFKLARKRALAHSLVGTATATAAVVGAVPIPFADALLLAPLEMGEVNALARIYGLNKTEDTKAFLNTIVEVGTVSTAAKTLLNALKAIPGINLGASVLNAIIAASIVAALGEGSIYAFEQVYLGNKTTADLDWIRKIMENRLAAQFLEKFSQALGGITDQSNPAAIVKAILEAFLGQARDKGQPQPGPI